MKFPLFVLAAAATASTAPPAPVFAATGAIQVSGAWSRPAPAGLPTGVVYLTIMNTGQDPDQLIGAQTPVAARMTLHRSSMADGVMSMADVPGGAAVAPGGVLKLAPGGYHFMLEGLKRGLQPGDRFPATLTFAHAGPVKIQVQVQAGPSAQAGAMTMR